MVKKVNVPPSYRVTTGERCGRRGRRKRAFTEFADRWGIKKTYFGDEFIGKLCADSRVETVDIGLPNFLHERAAKVASENGKHVIYEKPLARSAGEAKAILNAVETAKVIESSARCFYWHFVP